MSIEGLVAVASLAGAITAILIATKVIAGPASLALVASPAGIAVLFIAAVYFAAAAYCSYQQMNAMGSAKGEKGPQGEKGDPGEKGPQGEKGDKGNELTDNDFKEKVKGILPTLLEDPDKTPHSDQVRDRYALQRLQSPPNLDSYHQNQHLEHYDQTHTSHYQDSNLELISLEHLHLHDQMEDDQDHVRALCIQ
uniref:Uncharacterized protein n=1 Tax=Glossina austeni TaxID=7395 RepID=A0A1A9VKB7_GLOAU